MFESLRIVRSSTERLAIVRGVLLPLEISHDQGAMLTVYLDQADGGVGVGYCAMAQTSQNELQHAREQAMRWARAAQRLTVFDGVLPNGRWPRPEKFGLEYRHDAQPLPSRKDLIALLRDESAAMAASQDIVSHEVSLTITRLEQELTIDGQLVSRQQFQFVVPSLEASSQVGDIVQTRSLAGQYNGYCQQGGFEVIEASGLIGAGGRTAAQALALAQAKPAPSGIMDLVLAPDQMMLQIHESIGHPLELDRILGDERNFAGTSFVTPDMFGHYRYGSTALNVSFDPTVPGELASYRVDDDGTVATKTMLIENGVLMRPLGGALSRARLSAVAALPPGCEGIANSRAIGWHRPSIDRMANLNIEPGHTSFGTMIGSIEDGLFMATNRSWSIDDSRNKFQFSCEWGQRIRNGELAEVVRNPGYRGVSAQFWRSLQAVGPAEEREIMGTPFCGKGEPGQVIRVGHASPPCWFSGVEVFGG
jgi:predicted Zn-dependent protease